MTIGKTVKAQGVKGEVKAELYTNDALRLKQLKSVFIDDKEEINIEFLRVDKNCAFIKFKGVDTRDAAEKLVGKTLEVEREALPKLPENSYYIADLLGCKVYCGGKEIGVLTDVLQYSSTDTYVLDGGKIMFPALKALIEYVDIAKGEILLNGNKFEEVAVFNEV